MSSQTADSSSTYLELGWTSPHIKLGNGYDFGGRQLRDTALENVNSLTLQQSGEPDRLTNIHSITTSKELKSRIQADLKANIPLEGVSIKTENSYLSSLEISNTSLTQVIQETWAGKPATIDVHQLQMTEGARKLLGEPDGWQQFSQKYGEYFVYGYIARARFSAIASIKTSSESTRDEIKTSLEVAAGSVSSIGATLESIKSSKEHFATIDIAVDTVGFKNVPPGKEKESEKSTSTSTNKIDEVQQMYQNFSQNHELQPYVGLLCHYSVLRTTASIPLPVNQFAHLGPDINKMYKGLYTAQIEISASPMVQASATGKRIADLCEKIRTLNLTNAQAIKSLSDNFDACMAEVDAWRLRSDLIEDVKKLKNNALNWGNWTEAFGQREWASGILGLEGSSKYDSLKGDCVYKDDHFTTSYKFGKYSKHTSVLGDHDKIIIGFKINSYWNDSSNGWFNMHSGNVLESEINVEFSSYKTRGCDWRLEVWMVPKLMYEKKQV